MRVCFWHGVLLVLSVCSNVVYAGYEEVLKSCSISQYFDVSSLSCRSCSVAGDQDIARENVIPDTSYADSAGQALRCSCRTGYRKLMQPSCFDSAKQLPVRNCFFTCESCINQGLAASLDGTQCLPCGSNATMNATQSGTQVQFDSSLGECRCPLNQILYESDVAGNPLGYKACAPCPQRSRRFYPTSPRPTKFPPSAYQCYSCPHSNMSLLQDGICACDPGFSKVGDSNIGDETCVQSDKEGVIKGKVSNPHEITYHDVQTSSSASGATETIKESHFFKHIFMRAAVRCWFYSDAEDSTSCQALANLCVLQHYSPDSGACEVYESLVSGVQREVHNVDEWKYTLPWLEYDKNAGGSQLTSRDLALTLSFDAPKAQGTTYDRLHLKLAMYSMEGQYMGTKDLTNQFYYCSPPPGQNYGPSLYSHWLKVWMDL